jgi:hypothetical protein
VGQLSGTSGAKVVLLVSKDFAVAYACNNRHIASLVGGKALSGSASLNNEAGAKASVTFNAREAKGTFFLPAEPPALFVAVPATGRAGFYVADATAKAGHLAGRWVVGTNGASAGVLRLNGTIISNRPIARTISLESTVLHPRRTTVVLGYPQSLVFPNVPVYPAGPVHPGSPS